MMLDLDFRYAIPAPVGHYRHETMELTVQLHMAIFDYFTPVGFEAIIDVMQVNARHLADHAIEYARRKGFRDRIKTGVFPTRNQVISFIEFRQKIWNLFRVILQVAIHSKNDRAATVTESSYKRRRFAKIFAKSNDTYNARMFSVQLFQFQKGFIGTAVVNKDDFITLTKGIKLR